MDIDGVLNPEYPDEAMSFHDHTIGGLTVRLCHEHDLWLSELVGRFELVWASTWEADANRHIAPLLGLPELPYVEFSAYERRSDDPRVPILQLISVHKWAPILRHADGRRFAWVDDIIPARVKWQAWPHRGALGAVPRLSSENTTLKQRVRELTQASRTLEERLQSARSNARFADRRVAQLEAELLS